MTKKQNNILSKKVANSAISGNGINVMRNSVIDKHSSIGSYTYIGLNCFITKADIGRYCSIANNVSIGQGEHKIDRISTCSRLYDEDAYEVLTEKDVTLCNDIWICTDVVINQYLFAKIDMWQHESQKKAG